MSRALVQLLCAGVALSCIAGSALAANRREPRTASEEADEQYDRIELADPRAVPIGLRWLSEGLTRVEDHEFRSKLLAGVATVEGFQLDDAGPDLVALYRIAADVPVIRNNIAFSASKMRTGASRKFLEMLRNAQSLSPASHIFVVSALTSLNDESARKEFLQDLDAWANYLSTHAAWRNDLETVPFATRSLDDQAVRDELKRLIDAQTDDAVADKMQKTLDWMQMYHLSVDELFHVLEAPPPKASAPDTVAAKHLAMVMIGFKAGPDAIPRIRKIDASKIPATPSAPGQMPFEFSATRDDAIRDIRRRHWKELAQSPSTQPATSPDK